MTRPSKKQPAWIDREARKSKRIATLEVALQAIRDAADHDHKVDHLWSRKQAMEAIVKQCDRALQQPNDQ